MKLQKGWFELERPTENLAWKFMYDSLGFRPSIESKDFPGIVEPSPSETYSIGHIYQPDQRLAELLELDLEEKMLRVFRKVVEMGERLIVLDWQHSCFWFDPAEDAGPWNVPLLPNGDYYIFLASDFRFGIFGHPWEETMCVFGSQLLETLQDHRPHLFQRPIRRNGVAVGREN